MKITSLIILISYFELILNYKIHTIELNQEYFLDTMEQWEEHYFKIGLFSSNTISLLFKTSNPGFRF